MQDDVSSMSQANLLPRAIMVLTGTMLLSFALGSIHAFSVLMPAMEETFGTSRMSASMTYSLALITLAFAVFLGHRAYSKIPPALYVMGTGLIAALGCLIAGFSGSVPMVWFGFSLLFGGANGLGYGYALQFSAQAMPNRKGFAMGAVTAAYALGAVIFTAPLSAALNAGGWASALALLSFCIFIISSISAILLARSRIVYKRGITEGASVAKIRWQVIALLWLAYGCAVTAGLMAIGHATGIAKAANVSDRWVIAAPIIIALANMVGSLFCGALLDKLSGRLILSIHAVLSSCALIAISILPQAGITMVGLAIVGFAYGGTISVYPAFISKCFGAATGTIIYGRVFTAWAVAGLIGPGSAGFLFDLHQDYSIALIMAAAIALCSLVLLKILNYASSDIAREK